MMRRLSALALLCMAGAAAVGAQSSSIDFVAVLIASADSGKSVGLHKFSRTERAELNQLLNRIYDLGRRGVTSSVGTSDPAIPPAATLPRPPSSPTVRAYLSKVDAEAGGVVTLANGAIAEVTTGYVGYVGYRRDAALLTTASSFRIWIKGKRVYRCSLLKAPTSGTSRGAVETSISEVAGSGRIIKVLDGSTSR